MKINEQEILSVVRRLEREEKSSNYSSRDADLEADETGYYLLARLHVSDAETDDFYQRLPIQDDYGLSHETLAAGASRRALAMSREPQAPNGSAPEANVSPEGDGAEPE